MHVCICKLLTTSAYYVSFVFLNLFSFAIAFLAEQTAILFTAE